MIDQEHLIRVVREQRLLWDKRHKSYRNRSLTKKAWKYVALALHCTSEEAQSKWKNLRDSFSRELKKATKQSGNNAIKYTGDWHYFEPLQFLKDSIRHRENTDNCTSPEVNPIYDETFVSVVSDSTGIPGGTDNPHVKGEADSSPLPLTEEIQCESYQGEPGPSDGLLSPDMMQKYFLTPAARALSNDYTKQSEFAEIFADLEKQKINLMKKEMQFQEDEDMNWFKSILPHLKKLPSMNKLVFRTKVQEMLLKELADVSSPQVQSSASQHDSSTIAPG